MKCSEIIDQLEKLAPAAMACEWDNPGLLAGRSDKKVTSILLAVDVTDSVLEQAEAMGADMIITHHPLIFKPLKKVNDQDFISRRIRAFSSPITDCALRNSSSFCELFLRNTFFFQIFIYTLAN